MNCRRDIIIQFMTLGITSNLFLRSSCLLMSSFSFWNTRPDGLLSALRVGASYQSPLPSLLLCNWHPVPESHSSLEHFPTCFSDAARQAAPSHTVYLPKGLSSPCMAILLMPIYLDHTGGPVYRACWVFQVYSHSSQAENTFISFKVLGIT